MRIDEWIAQIQAHRVLVIFAGVFLLAFLVFAIRMFRRRPIAAMLAFVSAILVLCGIVTLDGFIETTKTVRAAHSWPTTTGVITLSRRLIYYQTFRSSPGEGPQTPSKTSQIDISYQYTVENHGPATTYTSSLVYLSHRSQTGRLLTDYPVGKKVTVHYQPNDPSHSILELESTDSFLNLFVGVMLILLAVVITYLLVTVKSIRELVRRYQVRKNPGMNLSP